jgi:surfeit locus 1 family protein
MRIGRRTFAPSWVATALTLAVCVGFAGLGHWQWERGNLREAQAQEFARGADRVQPLGSRGLSELPRFQSVSIIGRFDAQHQFLLDNRVHQSRAGYEVLTPFELADGRVVLVNRGWIPFTGYRDRLPDVSFSAGEAPHEVAGRLDELPAAGLPRGRAAPHQTASWPKLTSFPDVGQLSAALGRKIESRILLLDARAPNGYVRHWQPPGLTPQRHWAYAFQWWAFAAAALVLWFVLSLRKDPESA